MLNKKTLAAALILFGTGILLMLPLTASAASWSAPFALGSGSEAPAVAIDSSGNQHYVWANESSGTIQYAECTGLAGTGCSRPQNLPSPAGASSFPSIALDIKGRPNVVWDAKTSDGNVYEVFWSRLSNGSWSSPIQLSNQDHSEVPDIGIDSQGTIHVVYESIDSAANNTFIYYVESSNGSSFSPAFEVAHAKATEKVLSPSALAQSDAEGAASSAFVAGLNPHLAVDAQDHAHIVWNNPNPYGILYRYQTANGWSSTIQVAKGQKDQTPDITVNANGDVGIVWGTYDNFNVAFAQYSNDTQVFHVNDADGGLAESLIPRIESDCAGNFHLVFQGSVGADSHWNIYHRAYNPGSKSFAARDTVAAISAQEQTPGISATNLAAIVYWNSTNKIADASTLNLGISCSGSPQPTAVPTGSPAPTTVPGPTAVPGEPVWIPNQSNQITYKKGWKTLSTANATDGNYAICQKGSGGCVRGSGARIVVPDGYTHVQLYTATSKKYGIANIWVNDGTNSNNKPTEMLDLCQGNHGNAPTFITKTYEIPVRTDGQARSFEIGGTGNHSSCTKSTTNAVALDGFKLLP